MSNVGPEKAWNATPDKPKGGPTGRLQRQGREPVSYTRCTFYVDGVRCDTFPSWPVPGTKRERRCETHRGEAQ